MSQALHTPRCVRIDVQVAILVIPLPSDASPSHPLISAVRDELLIALHGATTCRFLCKCLGVTMQQGKLLVVNQVYKASLNDVMLGQPGVMFTWHSLSYLTPEGTQFGRLVHVSHNMCIGITYRKTSGD